MEPTIKSGTFGDLLIATKPFSAIQVGDIVVADSKKSEKWSSAYEGKDVLKRVVATPGQHISADPNTGELLVDGVPSPHEWAGSSYPFMKGSIDCHSSPRSQQCFPAFTVPEGEVLLLGDNRAESKDSLYGCRGEENADLCLGTFPIEGIKQRVLGRVLRLS